MAEDQKPKGVAGMTIEHIMTEDVTTVDPGLTVRAIIKMFIDKKIAGAPVVDTSKHVLSVVSEANLMMFAAKGGMDKTINEFLSEMPKAEEIVSVGRQDAFVAVFKQFLTKPVRRVMVVDGSGKLQGLVSRRNILKAFMEGHENEEKTKEEATEVSEDNN